MTLAVTELTVLAHAGPGATWQAMVVVVGVVLFGVVLAAGFGLLHVGSSDDLMLPLAGAAIASSLGALASEIVSDGIGWGLPLAVIGLAALLLAAFTPLDLRLPGPLAMGTIALAIVAVVGLYAPLTAALHPPGELLPLADDIELTITSPADGDAVAPGDLEVVVEVTGGSLGPGIRDDADPEADPEEAGALAIAIAELADDGSVRRQSSVDPVFAEACTVTVPCDRVTLSVPAPAGAQLRIIVEFLRADGLPLAPFVRDQVTVTVE